MRKSLWGISLTIAAIVSGASIGISSATADTWLDDCLVDKGIEQVSYYKAYVLENRCSDRSYDAKLSVTLASGEVVLRSMLVGRATEGK